MSYNAAKQLFLLFLGFDKCRKAEQASGRCSNLRTTFFPATGVTHPLSSTRSSLSRPGNNELNQDRASVLSHTHTSWTVLQKKKHNMNNLQPDLHSAPSLPCPWKEWNKDESRECHFCLLRMIPWTEIWIMAILCLEVFCIYQGGSFQ